MAIPSLKNQIGFVDTIVILRAVLSNGNRQYKIDEVLKSRYATLAPGDFINADLSIFELLGYSIQHDQQVVAFLAIRKNLVDYDCIDFLPVSNESILYAKDDASVCESLTLDKLRTLVSVANSAS